MSNITTEDLQEYVTWLNIESMKVFRANPNVYRLMPDMVTWINNGGDRVDEILYELQNESATDDMSHDWEADLRIAKSQLLTLYNELIAAERDRLLTEVGREVIGEMEQRETSDMSLKSWMPDDYKAFGRNELRNEQRQALQRLRQKEEL